MPMINIFYEYGLIVLIINNQYWIMYFLLNDDLEYDVVINGL